MTSAKRIGLNCIALCPSWGCIDRYHISAARFWAYTNTKEMVDGNTNTSYSPITAEHNAWISTQEQEDGFHGSLWHWTAHGTLAPSCAGLQTQASSPVPCMSGIIR